VVEVVDKIANLMIECIYRREYGERTTTTRCSI